MPGVFVILIVKRDQAIFETDDALVTDRHAEKDVLDIISELSAITEDSSIACVLNCRGLRTATDKSWNSSRIKWIRQKKGIAAFSKDRLEKSGMINLEQAAHQLGISTNTVHRFIKIGLIEAKQVKEHAPWLIARSELEKTAVAKAVQSIQINSASKTESSQECLNL